MSAQRTPERKTVTDGKAARVALRSIKTRILIALMLMTCLTSCASTAPETPTPVGKVGDISNAEAEQKPFVGMTKAQALARYGEPKKHTVTSKGEEWVYILNFGEVIGKAFIPFNFNPTPVRTGVLLFGPDGKVKEFTWDVPTEG